MTLETVLADLAEDAQVLRRRGRDHDAALLERVSETIRAAAADYLEWLSESDAVLRSGKSVRWLRARFDAWEWQGHATIKEGIRWYRTLVLPTRQDPTAFTAGRVARKSA